jgi:hypothetical protein
MVGQKAVESRMTNLKLTTLRRSLSKLRKRRRNARWGAGIFALAAVLLAALALVFLTDWLFDLPRWSRLTVMIGAGVAVLWACWRLALPWFAGRETDLDMALLIEKRQHIDSDLVAALEFESPAAMRRSSRQLETAVVDYVAEFGQGLHIDDACSRRPMAIRGLVLAGLGLVIVPVALYYHEHTSVFFHRLLLESVHYPVNTHIDGLVLNGERIDLASETATRSPYGKPVRFEVHGSGVLPATGQVAMTTLADGGAAELELAADASQPGVFVGSLPQLIEPLRYRLYLGDDWTEPHEIVPIPLPVVTVALEPTPPAYAVDPSADSDRQAGARQISIVEGTQVAVRVECANKALKQVVLSIGDSTYPLRPQDNDPARRAWRLDPEGTPLAHITEPIRYEIQVVDVDGLELAEPVQGFIRIKTDRPPRVTAALVTQHVLPSGKPTITYGAADDYGIARLQVHRQVLREDGSTQEDSVDIPLPETRERVVQGRYSLDLAPLKLVKGDQLKITLEARDYRGELPAKSAVSEPLVLHVTDERGVLAAMSETDQRSARQLDAIIQRQLGLGE